jgi:hypothetical protein
VVCHTSYSSRATFPVQVVNTVQAYTSRVDHLTLHAVLVLLLLHERLSATTGYTGLALYLVHSLLRRTTALSSTSITSRRTLAKILLVVTSLHECPETLCERHMRRISNAAYIAGTFRLNIMIAGTSKRRFGRSKHIARSYRSVCLISYKSYICLLWAF